jgi:hypothetical protein
MNNVFYMVHICFSVGLEREESKVGSPLACRSANRSPILGCAIYDSFLVEKNEGAEENIHHSLI